MQRVPPFVYSIFNVRYKTGRDYRVPPFEFFSALCDFFSKFFCRQRVPLQVFLIFCSKLKFQKAQRVSPSTILKTLHFLSLRYSADFRRSRLVSFKGAITKTVLCLFAVQTMRSSKLKGFHFVFLPPCGFFRFKKSKSIPIIFIFLFLSCRKKSLVFKLTCNLKCIQGLQRAHFGSFHILHLIKN